ncbi:MAG: tyrosine--tRNA ligase [Bacteroidia bacterium]|nr:tyrosine--tRNA ligase [Bacteroidia bacterium]MCX7763368.1 tyrosine--tRNA ligase [Bacteroidia bacterium]MDW8056853.1 tyrosine--tRNA ligase [Bacteroidia bacterium]
MHWIEPLRIRGLIQDFTPLPDSPEKIGAAYVGIDPTADSLHIGHLAPLQLLYHLAQMGIQPIVVIGGATARIGDPSGKKSERPLLPVETIRQNAQKLAAQVQKLLPFPLTLLDNYDWLGQLSLLDFLRDIGKSITVSYLLAKETVQSRLESGISFTEFSYALLQAYDFYYLFQTKGCKLQIGGGDQWGNITTGIELIRKLTGEEVYGMTCPLLTRSDGSKFGKSEGGENVWLDPQKTSPYKFYQFWLNQADADMPRLLGVFSWASWGEIQELLARHAAAPEQRLAQRALAYEMTARIHGEETARAVQQVSEVVFGSESLDRLETLAEPFFEAVVREMPHYSIPEAQLSVIEALVRVGFLRSKSEGRQLLQQAGLSVNRQRITDEKQTLADFQPLRQRYWLIQRGRKHMAWLYLDR